MTKIKDIETALNLFEEAAIKNAEAVEQGDYKTANKNYDKYVKACAYLKEKDEIDKLLAFLDHSSVGVRMVAATYLLPKHGKKSIKVLKEISKGVGAHAFTAEMTLSEWKKGNLKL